MVALAACMALMAPAGLVRAQPTSLTLFEAVAFTSVIESGDALVLGRYELPSDQWDPASGGPGAEAAVAILKDASTEYAVRPLPRTGHGLVGVYLAPEEADAFPFGAEDAQLCIQGDPATLTTPPSCQAPTWRSTATTEEARQALEADLVQLVFNLESEDPDVTSATYVANGVITQAGYPLAEEAFPAVGLVVPGAFFAGVEGMAVPAISQTPGAREQTVRDEARSSAAYQAAEEIAGEYFGTSVRVAGGVAVMSATLALAALIYAATRELTLGAGIALPSGLLFGAYLDLIPQAAAYVVVFVLVIALGMWLFRRLPL